MTARRRRAAAATVRRRTPVVVPAAIVFPTDAGVVNVKTAPYNAAGDGIADDTAALQAAFDANDYEDADATHVHIERPAARTLYLPEGTYRVTDSLTIVGSSVRIIGAGEGKTFIKLDNSATGFNAPATPKYLLRTGTAGGTIQENAGYANYVQHLTLDIGSGNSGAVGCRFSVANSGAMQHVTIKSSDAAKVGLWGLQFGTSAGPGIVSDVTIDGFEVGVYADGSLINDIVLPGLTLRNQRTAGIQPGQKSLVLEGLVAENVPRVVETTDAKAAVQIVGATIGGTGAGPAIQLDAASYFWGRDITVTGGFPNIVTQGTTARFTGATFLREWASVNYRRGNTSTAWTESNAYVGLNLPIKKAPEYINTTLSEWTSPQAHGYTGTGDVGPALTAAIASGAKVIYFPYGRYTLSSAVTVQGAVRKIEGMHSVLEKGTGGSLTVGNVDDGELIIENLIPRLGLTYVHNSPDTVVLRHLGNLNNFGIPLVQTGSSATGDLFIEGVGSNVRVEITRPIGVWIRQLNRERGEFQVSGGATVWVLGDNIELHIDYVDADAVFTGSTVEVIGGAFDVLNFPDAYPTTGKAAYTVTDSTVSIVLPGSLRGTTTTMGHWVSDTVSGTAVGHVYDTTDYDATTGQTDDRVAIPMYRSP